MQRVAMMAVIVLGCAGCFMIRNSVETPQAYERPDWVDKSVWKEQGKIYAVGVQVKSRASVDDRSTEAELSARQRIARYLDVCQVTLIAYSTFRQWVDRDGTIYILMRVDEYIAWEKCPAISVYSPMDFSSGFLFPPIVDKIIKRM